MNWLLIIVVLILAFCVIRGFHRGFLRMVYSMISWILIFVFVTWATPYITTFLMENTSLYAGITTYCEETIRQKAEEKTEEQAETVVGEQTNQIADLGINLPESVINNITDKTAGVADDILESSGVYEQMSQGMANFILDGISFFIALAAAMIVSHFIFGMLGIVSKIPIIHGVNKYLGLIAGAIYGLVIIWIAFYLIALCSTSEAGGALVTYIYDSPLLTYIYENNLIVTLLIMYL